MVIPPTARVLGSHFIKFPPGGAACSSHGVEIERVTDGQISLTGETEDCQYGAVEGPRNNISLNGWMLMFRRVRT